MTIDHIGAILYPDIIAFRIIGRISFPLFSYLLALGVESTRNRVNYFVRLLIFGFISQVPFFLAFGYEPFEMFNIFFTLSFSVLLFLHPPVTFFSILLYGVINFDYGIFGIILIMCMFVLRKNKALGVTTYVLLNAFSFFIWEIQIFSLLALPFILLYERGFRKITPKTVGMRYPTWRKYSYYIYYPLHLLMLYLVKAFSLR